MRKSSRFDNILNQRGMALATVMLVMLVLILFSTGIVFIGISNFKQSKTTVDHNQAYYVAEAGVNYLVESLNNEISINGSKTTAEIKAKIFSWADKYAAAENFQLNLDFKSKGEVAAKMPIQPFIPSINIYVTRDDLKDNDGDFIKDSNGNRIPILNFYSTGTIGNTSRKLTKQITLNETIFANAILSYGNLNINKLIVNGGTVQTLTNQPSTININTGQNQSNLRSVKIATRNPDASLANCTKLDVMNCEKGKDPIIKFVYYPSFELPAIIVPSFQKPNAIEILGTDIQLPSFVSDTGVISIDNSSLKNRTYKVSDKNGVKTDFYTSSFILNTISGFSIDVGDSDVKIWADNLTINGSVNIINGAGKGSITIYVPANHFNFSCLQKAICGALGPSKDDVSSQTDVGPLFEIANKFRVIIMGQSEDPNAFSINLKGVAYMNLISDFNLEITGNAMYNGFFITSGNTIKLNGTVRSNAIIYAPNADIILGGNAGHTGSVIGNTFENKQSGASSFNYFIPTNMKPPFNILNPFTSNSYGSTVEN